MKYLVRPQAPDPIEIRPGGGCADVAVDRVAGRANAAVAAALLLAVAAGISGWPQAHAAQAAAAPSAAASAAPAGAADEAAHIAAAQAAARGWLARLDADDAGACWDQSSAAFRKAVTRDKWISDLKTLRDTVGPVRQRDAGDARFTRSLPGAPPASYVLIQNSVSFEKRPAGIETVTMVREEDGNWRLAGYFIR